MRRIFLRVSWLGLVFALGTAGTASADTTLGSTSEPAGVTEQACQPNIVVAQLTENRVTISSSRERERSRSGRSTRPGPPAVSP